MNITDIEIPKTLFITGTDTDAGKSYATGLLAKAILDRGESVTTQKFVQTGNRDFSEDIEVHRRLMGIEPTTYDRLHVTAPVIFTYPCSPELAARIDGTEIDFKIIEDATETLASAYDHVLIEGAGGLMVPLKGEYLTMDYIREHKIPVAVTANSKLGSINHILLTLNAISHAGIDLFAVLYNTYFDKDKTIAADTKEFTRRWLAHHFPDAHYIEF